MYSAADAHSPNLLDISAPCDRAMKSGGFRPVAIAYNVQAG
jgi:hypothetical protein